MHIYKFHIVPREHLPQVTYVPHIHIHQSRFQLYFTSVKQTSRNCKAKQLRVIFETDCLVRATKIHAELQQLQLAASLVNKPARGIQVDSTVKLPVRSYARRRDFTKTYSHLEKHREREREGRGREDQENEQSKKGRLRSEQRSGRYSINSLPLIRLLDKFAPALFT